MLSHTIDTNQHLPIAFCCWLIDLLSIIPGLDILFHTNKLTKKFDYVKLCFFSSFCLTSFSISGKREQKYIYSIRLQSERTKHTQRNCGTRKLERKNMTVVSVQLRKLFHSNWNRGVVWLKIACMRTIPMQFQQWFHVECYGHSRWSHRTARIQSFWTIKANFSFSASTLSVFCFCHKSKKNERNESVCSIVLFGRRNYFFFIIFNTLKIKSTFFIDLIIFLHQYASSLSFVWGDA